MGFVADMHMMIAKLVFNLAKTRQVFMISINDKYIYILAGVFSFFTRGHHVVNESKHEVATGCFQELGRNT